MKIDDFVWHDGKAEHNFRDHDITFEAARRVFEDVRAIWDDDTDSSWNENRFRIIGSADGRVMVLSYTYRGDEDVIRLISARRATKRERNDYYRG